MKKSPLEVVNYLREYQTVESALDNLHEEYAIKTTIWEDKLVTLNYDQINSPKLHNITAECRSLVLELGTWNVVSESFRRFFNQGETGAPTDLNMEECEVLEKVDGSLIKVFEYQGEWLYSTRSMIMPTAIINGNVAEVTWKDRIEEPMKIFYETNPEDHWLDENATYILELTSRENRVVTDYDHDGGRLVLLAVRDRCSRDYYMGATLDAVSRQFGWRNCKTSSYKTMQEVRDAADNLTGLQEGFVVTHYCIPQFKTKSPAYLVAHKIGGNGLPTEGNILELIIINETDEHLAVYPERTYLFQPYLDAYEAMRKAIHEMGLVIRLTRDMTQKEFALHIKDSPVKGLGFSMRKGVSPWLAWEECTNNAKIKMILAHKETVVTGD